MVFCSSLFVPTLFLSSSSARKNEAFFQSSASISISTLSFLLFNHPTSRLPRTPPVKAVLFIVDGIPATAGATVFRAAELSPPRRLSLDATSLGIRSASSSAWICWRSATSTEDTRAKYCLVADVNCFFCSSTREVLKASALGSPSGACVRALIAEPADLSSLATFYVTSVSIALGAWSRAMDRVLLGRCR